MKLPLPAKCNLRFRWIYLHSLLVGLAVVSFSMTNPIICGLFERVINSHQNKIKLSSGSRHGELLGHHGWIYAVAISNDSNTLISGGFDKSIKFWNLSRVVKALNSKSTESLPKSQQILEGSIQDAHNTAVSAIAINPKKPVFATAGWDNRIKFWNLDNKDLVHTIEGAHVDDINAIAFTPDGDGLLSAGLDNVVHLWHAATGVLLQKFVSNSPVHALAVTPNGKLLVAGHGNGQVSIWNLHTGKLLTPLAAHQHKVSSVAISPDGKIIASSGSDKTIKLWRTDNNVLKEEILITTVACMLAFSPDGKLLASGNEDGTIKVWRVADGRLLHTWVNHKNVVWTVAFSPDGKALVAGSQDKKISIWPIQ